jgi:DNA modification methylase
MTNTSQPVAEVEIKCSADGFKLIATDSIVPNPKNNNRHSIEQLKALERLIRHHGFREPLLISNRSGFLIAGHGRLEAAKAIGMPEVPVIYQDFASEAEEYQHMTADNEIARWAKLDFQAVYEDLKSIPDLDTSLLGIENFVIPTVVEPQCDEDDCPDVRTDTISKPGDIWKLGEHLVICGDSTVQNDIQKLMGETKADMVWTDPPYNVAYKGKTKDSLTIENDEMGDEQFYKFLYDAYLNMILHTKEGGAIYVAHADSEGANFRKAMKDAGWLLKQCLIWVKQTLVMGRQDYHWKHEPILYGWAPGASHNWFTDRKQTTVLEFDKPARNAEHPTMKPVELVEYCIGNSCPPGGIVLDLFGGSGTTLIAAEKLGLKARLCELDPKYVDVIVARWQKFTGKTAELINGQTI